MSSVGVGERPAIRRNIRDVPTPIVTLVRAAPEPALPTPVVTLACDLPALAVPTPIEAPGSGGVGSGDCGEGVFRLMPTPAAGGTGDPIGIGDPHSE